METTLSPLDIESAYSRIDPAFLDSPVIVSPAFGPRACLKLEIFNPIRSFKGRGTDNFVKAYAAHLEPGLCCASAGNFGQGLAFSAQKHGRPLTVVVPEGANSLKVDRIRSFGAKVISFGSDFDGAKARARECARHEGLYFVEDGREVLISAGAGTLAIEMLRQAPGLDAIVVPLGNGALLAGVGCWVKHCAERIRVIGVCADGAPAMANSYHEKALCVTGSVKTFCDGVAVRVPVEEALAEIGRYTDDVLCVNDDATLAAMRILFERHGVMVEPSGALSLAALLAHPKRFNGLRVGAIITGANLTAEQIQKWYFA